MVIEFWSWHYHANPHQEEVEDTEFDIDKVMQDMADPGKWQDA